MQDQKWTDLLLLLSCQIIPVDIYVIGNWVGVGVQFALFRVQTAIGRWSFISLFRDIEFVIRGILSGKTGAGILVWAASAIILTFALFLFFFHEDACGSGGRNRGASYRKFIGLSLMGSGGLFLLSLILQYGPFFHGPAGFAIPIGAPFQLLTGYYLYRRPLGSGQVSPEKIAPAPVSRLPGPGIPRTLFALVSFLAIFATLNYILYAYPDSGGDFSTYCAAVDLWSHQGNPYDIGSMFQSKLQFRTFGTSYLDSFLYQPATLPLFEPICGALRLVYPFRVYFPVYSLVFLMAYLVASKLAFPGRDRLLLITLLMAGFSSTYWSFSTGNISILYLLLVSLVFYYFMKKRYYASSLCIALMSIFSIFPIIFSTLYGFSDAPPAKKVKIITFSGLVLGLSLAISFAAFPMLSESFWRQLAGGNSPIYEGSGYKTPTAYLFFQHLAALFIGKDAFIPYVLDALFIGSILVVLYHYYRKNRTDSPGLFSFGFMAIFLLIPRLKPNYFALILVPAYILISREGGMVKTIAIIIGAIIPFIFLVIADHMPTEGMTGDPISLMISFGQFLSALAIFLLIAWLGTRDRVGGGSSPFPALEGKQ
ncbi:MAG TPA: glycosyltransferase family 87 protein [Methanomicrobiales archaeon]|nr:glycosyltransferase family 87 protein [Methanomicrobiales archaeon]